MGVLEARFLTPGVALYDPAAPLKKAERAGAAPWEGAVEAIDVGPQMRQPPSEAPLPHPIPGEPTPANPPGSR
jgi:hypothetical protein